MFFEAGHGTAPDLIYARGVLDSPSHDPTSFGMKQRTLIVIEIGSCRDFGCVERLEAKTSKYAPLLEALRRYLGRVKFIAFPVRHAGTTLTKTLDRLTTAFSSVRPIMESSTPTGATHFPPWTTTPRPTTTPYSSRCWTRLRT
jgi:hypothetical protein